MEVGFGEVKVGEVFITPSGEVWRKTDFLLAVPLEGGDDEFVFAENELVEIDDYA